MTNANRSMDRRVVRTRAMLNAALISLVLEKSYDAITVEDVCKRANVGRSTFYGHYKCKDDLMRSGFNHLRDELHGLRSPASGTSQNAEESRLGFSRAVFEEARRHMDIHRALAGNRGDTLAFDTIRATLRDLVRGELAT